MQSQKFTSVVESMQRGETLVALKTIQTLTSKEKNKAKLSETELKLILVLKALCLTKIHEYGESLSIVTEFIRNEKDFIFSEHNVLKWLDYIAASLNLYKEVREFSSNIYNKAGNKEEHLIEYMNLCMKEYNYQEVFSAALRLFKLTSNPRFMFINVAFQYKALIKSEAEPKKLEIVYLFTEKLLKELKVHESKELDRLQKEALKLAVRVCFSVKKMDKALDFLLKFNKMAFMSDMETLEWLYRIDKELKTNESKLLVINQNYLRFQKEINLDAFVMEFQIYQNFLDYLFAGVEALEIREELLKGNELMEEDLFPLLKEPKKNEELISDFFGSLCRLKKLLYQKKTHKNFRFALQIFLSAIISLLRRAFLKSNNNEKQKALISDIFQNQVSEYIENFSNTMTFTEELQTLVENMGEEILEFSIQKLEKSLETETKVKKFSTEISLLKLKLNREFHNGKLSDFSTVNEYLKSLISLYFVSFRDLNLDQKTLEKGERHPIDEFLVIAADLLLVTLRLIFLAFIF